VATPGLATGVASVTGVASTGVTGEAAGDVTGSGLVGTSGGSVSSATAVSVGSSIASVAGASVGGGASSPQAANVTSATAAIIRNPPAGRKTLASPIPTPCSCRAKRQLGAWTMMLACRDPSLRILRLLEVVRKRAQQRKGPVSLGDRSLSLLCGVRISRRELRPCPAASVRRMSDGSWRQPRDGATVPSLCRHQ
jgi:hypothetical protein